jgi:hypothetical protein
MSKAGLGMRFNCAERRVAPVPAALGQNRSSDQHLRCAPTPGARHVWQRIKPRDEKPAPGVVRAGSSQNYLAPERLVKGTKQR